MTDMAQRMDRYPEDWGANPQPLLRKGSGNIEVLLGNGKSAARVRKHTLSWQTPALLWGSLQCAWRPRAGKTVYNYITGWNGVLPEMWQKDKRTKQTRVLARGRLEWGPWDVGQE